jgi:hypothetical protein
MKITTSRPLTIQKEQHQAVIYLPTYRIVGTVHLPVGGRMSDFINSNVAENPFVPLTAVSVYSAGGNELLFTADFLAVHRSNISFLTIDKKVHGTVAAPAAAPRR